MIVEETRVFELDDNIAEDIMTLNRLGYITTFTCSGHLEQFDKLGIDCYSMGTYISFNNIARIQLSNEFGYNIPNNWIYDDRDKQLIIRRHYTQDEVDLLTKEQLLELTWSELHNWVESLPMVGYFNILGYEIKEFL